MTVNLFTTYLDVIIGRLASALWFTFHGWSTIREEEIVFHFDVMGRS